jgi:hypothetical protein
MARLVVGGGGGVPNRWDAVAETALARHRVDARDVRHGGTAQA